ncbi:MAG: hypothetical protein EOP35_24120 [Rubrivivax sp.]|nr:MAG: hypothetical protein EOP35_24120 [Rubrivivax sp.]
MHKLYLVGQHRGPSWEFQGVFSSPEAADAACKTRTFFVYPVTLDEEQPTETTPHQPNSVRWPRCNGAEPVEAFAQAWASRDVLAERQRQIELEGWTPEHDDAHKGGSMALAASCYAMAGAQSDRVSSEFVGKLWPWTGWAWQWWKPKDKRHNLVRAGALILAEIERLDRAADRQEPRA